MTKKILIKPIISEKSENLSENSGKYSFVVDKAANKIEIKTAIEKMYGVNVESVNTMVMPGKDRVRYTKRGVQRGRVSSFKKAIITVSDGEQIDLYGDI